MQRARDAYELGWGLGWVLRIWTLYDCLVLCNPQVSSSAEAWISKCLMSSSVTTATKCSTTFKCRHALFFPMDNYIVSVYSHLCGHVAPDVASMIQ